MIDIANKIIKNIRGLEAGSNDVYIHFEDGTVLHQGHNQDGCASVEVSQVDSSGERHIGATVIALLEKVVEGQTKWGSSTATFYTLQTTKGYLDWRWQGESNGYYSESVDSKLVIADCR